MRPSASTYWRAGVNALRAHNIYGGTQFASSPSVSASPFFGRSAAVMLKLAKWTQRSVPTLAAATGTPQLMTIPISHYCDMARLSLELNGIEYNELAYAPLQHVLPVLNLRCASAWWDCGCGWWGSGWYYPALACRCVVARWRVCVFSDRPSQLPSRVVALRVAGEQKHLGPRVAGAKPKPNPTAVPILVMPDGAVLNDSWAILNMAFGRGGAAGTGADVGGGGGGGGGGGASSTGPNLFDVTDPDRIFYDAHLGPDARQLA